MNNFNAGNQSFSRRQADIEGINQSGVENYNALKLDQDANFNTAKSNVAAANNALQTQTGIEEGFSGMAAEPLVKGGIDYGAKALYAAGKNAKAARLGTRSQALADGDQAGAEAAERPGMLENVADGMDSEIAQNIGKAIKAPGDALEYVGSKVGDAGKAIGKSIYRGGQAIKSKLAPQFRNRGDATNQEGTELEPQQPTEPSTTETSFGGPEVEAPRGNMPSENLARNTTTETSVEDLPAQGGVRSGQAVEERTLQSASEGAESESNTLVSSTGEEVGEVGAGETTGAAESAAVGSGAAGAGEAAAGAGEAAAAGAGEVAADAAAAGLDAAAAASEAVPGVGTVVGGLLAIGGGIAALFAGHHDHKSAPKPPPPPPKPTTMGVNISEAAPVMDSSIFRATGYNQLS